MNKRQVIKHIIKHYDGRKVNFGDHDMELILNNDKYHLVFIKVGNNAQITFNSKTHIEVAQGRLDGIRFKKRSSILYNLTAYSKRDNKILFLLGTPFRKLQYLNESDIIDVSNQKYVNDYHLCTTIKDLEMIE